MTASGHAARDRFSSFRVIPSGGAPLPPAPVEKFRAGFGPYIRNGYGLTGRTSPCGSVPPHLEAPVDGASGVPGPGTVVRIVDDRGEEVPFGEQGGTAVRGPQVAPGYGQRPDATAEAFPAGGLRTATSASWTPRAGCTPSTARRA